MSSRHPDLMSLGEKLTTEGPHKIERTPRRIRGLLNGVYVFDSLEACYVWEHSYYPYFYIPKKDFANGALQKLDEGSDKGYWLGRLSAGGKTTDRVLGFEGGLKGLVRVEVGAIDAWFAEDEPLLGSHPKDPYKRVECLPSSREIRIEFEGKVIARSSQNVFLHETTLRPRYYLSMAGLDWRVLSESKTETYCPYKGMANYYNVMVNGKEIKDGVWYYRYPTAESAMIAGKVCFYNEKFDVFLDGVKEDEL